MMSDDFSGLPVFLALVECKNFRAAGEQLGVTGSAVSQRLRQLEDRLGVALFNRTTRTVALTEAGEQLYRELAPAVAEVRAALASLDAWRGAPAGRIRLSVSSIAENFLSSTVIAEFLAAHPAIQLDIEVDDRDADPLASGFDAAVRLGETIAPDMVAVPVSTEQRQVIVGSPGYLAAHGTPEHPRDLAAHACIGWRAQGRATSYRWELVDRGREFEVAIDARVDTSDMGLMVRLACAGVGLTIGLEESFRPYLYRRELVTVLDRYCPAFPGFFLYYPRRAPPPLKLRALVDFLRARQRGTQVSPPPTKRKRR
jgi:DNA-binding transcriptional LysR family regulator